MTYQKIPLGIRFCLLLLILFKAPVHAQDPGIRYPFVDYSKNVFSGDTTSRTMNQFYTDFDRILRYGTDQLNVVHFGGSHIQADIWSNVVREHLQTIDPERPGSRGIVFPYKAAGTNRPYSYGVSWTGEWEGFRSPYKKHESTWGVLGIAATTEDPEVNLKFTFDDAVPKVSIRSILVLSNAGLNDYDVTVNMPEADGAYTVTETMEGYHRFDFFTDLDSLELTFTKPEGSDDKLQFYGVVLDNINPGITYHSIGVNGSSFESFERCDLFDEQLRYLHPDLVIISIGTNDTSEPDYDSTAYRNRYRAFLDKIRLVNPDCAFILTVPNDSYVGRKRHNDNLTKARNVIYEVAAEYDARVWDLYSIMGGAGSAKIWLEKGMMKPDLVHFTKEGYLLKGEIFTEALRDDYLKWYQHQEPVWKD